ncbi:acyl carrier protein [Rathayibacter tritici]|uniref:acyl carrier protein n=1 Tax=Rathayibacter tritici TaxID=33888 RepID=UPI000CE93958|nr:acyl carrier protein [Rathayibacter tritici]PPF66081.1 acyl carrier protein [Rathayibacter tritici]PPG06650.1 acyl carrier protein [Rathayibacter tritici]
MTDTATPTTDDSASVLAALRVYVVEEFLPGTDPERVEIGLDLLNSGIIDSLGLLKLIAWLETRFDVGIDDTDLDPENFRSLATIVEFVIRPRPSAETS